MKRTPLRPVDTGDSAADPVRLLEPRRLSCPWCGAAELRLRMVTRDLVQGKPGRFTLEECTLCGHVFQNPRLSPRGLEYYYRDVYDGDAARWRQAFTLPSLVYVLSWQRNTGRVAAVAAATHSPLLWLDVGAGYGNLCAKARKLLPGTVFDGLDASGGIEQAQRRGWVRHALRGQFLDLAGDLAGTYDVVSMIHYLEHTEEPVAELEAACRVLVSGGLLLVEVPNPHSRAARMLGQWWSGWLAPQHLHMFPPENLTTALAERGFELVEVQLGAANMPYDLTCALLYLVNDRLPDPRRPWRDGQRLRSRLWRRRLAMPAVAALTGLTLLVDHLCHLWTRRGAGGNAYRVLARKVGA